MGGAMWAVRGIPWCDGGGCGCPWFSRVRMLGSVVGAGGRYGSATAERGCGGYV